MSGRMKVMIACDSTICAEVLIEDLRRAGLPRDGEAMVVSVADLAANIAPISEFDLFSVASRRAEAVLRRAKSGARRAIEEAEKAVSEAETLLRSQFPEWQVERIILQGAPGGELLRKAAEWKPHLIVVGSRGRGKIGRFILGSVSKKIAEEAKCSVRVARRGYEKEADAPAKIIVGANSLPAVERVVQAVVNRAFSKETQVRLIKVDDGVSAGRVSAVYPYAEPIIEQAANELRAAGLQVSVVIQSGDLKSVLLEEAKHRKADTIFVAAGGANNEPELSQTAANLITDANCTVEIVR